MNVCIDKARRVSLQPYLIAKSMFLGTFMNLIQLNIPLLWWWYCPSVMMILPYCDEDIALLWWWSYPSVIMIVPFFNDDIPLLRWWFSKSIIQLTMSSKLWLWSKIEIETLHRISSGGIGHSSCGWFNCINNSPWLYVGI